MRPRAMAMTLAAALLVAHPVGAWAKDGDPAAEAPANAAEPASEETPRAESAPATESAPDPASEPVTAADVEAAPRPDQAHGMIEPRDHPGAAWWWIPRAVLSVPRWALEAGFALPRQVIWVYGRYQLKERFISWFFNDAETFGVFPTAFIETGFGPNVGARLIYRDIFGHDERLSVRAGYGGRFNQVVSAAFTTGELLGERWELEFGGRYDVHPRDRFFGFGNADEAPATAAGVPIDPLLGPQMGEPAVATRYRHDDSLATLLVRHSLGAGSVQLAGTYKRRRFDSRADVRTDAHIEDVFDTSRLIGYDTDLQNLYGELELGLDTRRALRHYLATPAPSTGWHVVGFAGYQHGLGSDPSAFVRWGIDVQRLINLWRGDRVLVVRGYAEGVSGSADNIPFVDHPSLGGPRLLRGYTRDRFRDRYAALASLEYQYPIQRRATGYLFVDAGRPWRSAADLSLRDPRVGFGFGIQVHSMRSFWGRLGVASSIDGGIQFILSFDPVFSLRPRSRR